MILGFIGTGKISSSIVLGIFKSKLKVKRIYINYINNVWFGYQKLTHPSPQNKWKVKFDNTITHPSYIDCNALCKELDSIEYDNTWFKPSK